MPILQKAGGSDQFHMLVEAGGRKGVNIMEKIVKNQDQTKTKFVIEYTDYKYSKLTVVYISAYKQERSLNGRFERYFYCGHLKKEIKGVKPETREKALKKYLSKFGVVL